MIPIDALPATARAASFHLRDALIEILADDLVGLWVHGGTTFADRPERPGDLDVGAALGHVAPDERRPSVWRTVETSRPARIREAHQAIAREHGLEIDATYLLVEEMAGGRLPRAAFARSRRENGWAVERAHWLAGQFVHLHGRRPDELVRAPTPSELRFALDRELEHLERHVEEGDANDPYEATYAIWNGSRILYTLETGSPVVSKRSAGEWALEHLPQRWHAVIEAAGRSYDGRSAPADAELLRESMAGFVEMVRARLPRGRAGSRPPRWS